MEASSLRQFIHSLLSMVVDTIYPDYDKQEEELRKRIGAKPKQSVKQHLISHGTVKIGNGNEYTLVTISNEGNKNKVVLGGAVYRDGKIIGEVLNVTINSDPNQVVGNEPHLLAIRTLERAARKSMAELDELNLSIANQEQTLQDSYRGRELHENFIYRLGQSIEVLQKEHAAYMRDLQVPINIVRTKDEIL